MRRAGCVETQTGYEYMAQSRSKRLNVSAGKEAEPGRSTNKEQAVPSYDAVVVDGGERVSWMAS